MSKITINRLGSGYRSSNALNNDFSLIEEAFDNTLSRDGSGPNEMLAPLDMNSQRILNIAPPVEDTDLVRKQDVQDIAVNFVTAEIEDIATDAGTIAGTLAGSTAGTAAANSVTATKLNTDGSNPTNKDTVKSNLDIVSFKVGPTPVFQSRFGADWIWLNDPTVPNSRNGAYQGGAWAGTYKAGLIVSKDFKPGDWTGASGPLPGFLSTTFSAGDGPDACTVGTMAIATANYENDTAFGGNLIAAAEFGVPNTKLVGLEIDVQHSGHLGAGSGISGSGSAGLYINTFNAPNSGDGIQINAHDGYWSNGIKLAGINPTIGAGLSMTGNDQTIGSLVNTTVGNFAQAGLELGTGVTPGIRLQGPAGDGTDAARIFNSGGFLVLRQGSSSTVFQSHDGSTTYVEVQNGGSLNIAAPNAVLKTQGTQVVSSRKTGWAADTGTSKRTANATYSGTAEAAYTQATIQTLMNAVRDLSQTVKALKDDLISHGLIGS